MAQSLSPTPSSNVAALRSAVSDMDCLSQDGFSEIAAIAKLALRSLETPSGLHCLENIVYALRAIWGKADEMKNCINATAEAVGCHHVDEDERRRYAAYGQYRDEVAKGNRHV